MMSMINVEYLLLQKLSKLSKTLNNPCKMASNTFTTDAGVPITRVDSFEAKLMVHPKHAGFVLGGSGKTMKGIGSKYRVHIRLHNDPSGGTWPFFKIVGSGRSGMKSVEMAFVALRDVANIAFQKIPVPFVGDWTDPESSPAKGPSSPDSPPTSSGPAEKEPEPLEVERVTFDDGTEYLVSVGGGGIRKVVNEEGEEIGVYIGSENKVHLN